MNTENDIKMKELAEHFQQEQPHLMRYACLKSAQNFLMRRALK